MHPFSNRVEMKYCKIHYMTTEVLEMRGKNSDQIFKTKISTLILELIMKLVTLDHTCQ